MYCHICRTHRLCIIRYTYSLSPTLNSYQLPFHFMVCMLLEIETRALCMVGSMPLGHTFDDTNVSVRLSNVCPYVTDLLPVKTSRFNYIVASVKISRLSSTSLYGHTIVCFICLWHFFFHILLLEIILSCFAYILLFFWAYTHKYHCLMI